MSDLVRLVSIRFTMPEGLIPPELKRYQQRAGEREKEIKVRRESSGKRVLDNLQAVSLEQLPGDLKKAGYDFVAAAWDRKSTPDRKVYNNANYFFALSQFAEPADAFKPARFTLLSEMEILFSQTICTVRAVWDNPFYAAEGQAVPGFRELDIGLNGRQSIVTDDGAPILVSPKDTSGKKLKDGIKVPMRGRASMMFVDGALKIVPA